jgi:hypothetical protein
LKRSADGVVYRDLRTIVDKRAARSRCRATVKSRLSTSEGRERSADRLPYGAYVLFADGGKVKKGDKIAEWDPFTMPVITENPAYREVSGSDRRPDAGGTGRRSDGHRAEGRHRIPARPSRRSICVRA